MCNAFVFMVWHGRSLLWSAIKLSVYYRYIFLAKAASRRLVWLHDSAISCSLHNKCIVATLRPGLVDLADTHTALHLPNVLSSHCVKVPTTTVLCGSGNLIPDPLKTAHSCCQHGQVTAWFRSVRPGNAISVPKTFTLLGIRVLCLSQWNCFCWG